MSAVGIRRIAAAGLAALALALAAPRLTGQETSSAIRPTTTIKLFDGTSLGNFDAWLVDHHDADPEKVFTVVDQIDGAPAIRISGKVWGGLLTKQAYRDYRLIAEFRWGGVTWGNRKTRTRDSGVLLHARGRMGNTGKDFNGPWLMSHEFQIIEGGVGDFLPVAGYTESGEQILPVDHRQEPQGSRRRERLRPERPAAGVQPRPHQLVGPQRGLGGQARVPRRRRTSRARDSSGRTSRRSCPETGCNTSSTASS